MTVNNAMTQHSSFPAPASQEQWQILMQQALKKAGEAGSRGEVPVGAVLADVTTGEILSRGSNRCIELNDPTAHAEIIALRRAGEARRNYRLPGTVLAVTLEPCLMCLGAITQARIDGLVYGPRDPAAGALFSRLDILDFAWLSHKFWVVEKILEHECRELLQNFFRNRRSG